MKIIAEWKMPIFKADAQKCAEEIIALGDKITPDEVLEKARDESTELHKCFEWDDSVAAEKFRKIQARDVIRFIVIKEEEKPEDRPQIKVFHVTEKTGGYKPIEFIVKHEDEYKALLERAWAELRAFKAKYSMLEELREIMELID